MSKNPRRASGLRWNRAPSPRARGRALFCCLVWIAGIIVAPLAHAEEHLRESRALELELARAARARTAAAPLQPGEADLALLAADALAWQEALFSSEETSGPANIDLIYGPLVAYELRTEEAREGGVLHLDGNGRVHGHAGAAGHSHSHSHGKGESSNPFEHGQGTLAHSGVALRAAPVATLVIAPVAAMQLVSYNTASCQSTPGWQRPRCAQSPPAR